MIYKNAGIQYPKKKKRPVKAVNRPRRWRGKGVQGSTTVSGAKRMRRGK